MTESGSWSDADSPGTINALYLEDNDFQGPSSGRAVAFDAYYGARVVARYNEGYDVSFTSHGTAGARGSRYWEYYRNTFTGSNSINCLRAGSGIIFDNSGLSQIFMVEENSGYPAEYQIGRGQDQNLFPAYVWNNGLTPSLNSIGCAPPVSGMVQLNRDVYYPSSGTSLHLANHHMMTVTTVVAPIRIRAQGRPGRVAIHI